MDNFDLIEKAHYYTTKSHHVSDVTPIKVDEANKKASFTAIFKLEFGSKIEGDATDLGVKREEPVTFKFDEHFPQKAPFITLRKDFPKIFEHINPIKNVVNPCIYEANLSELLQQPGFFDEVLDQMALWLDKTTTNSLFDKEQGWEPMRCDELHGVIDYPISIVENFVDKHVNIVGIFYEFVNKFIRAKIDVDTNHKLNKTHTSLLIPFWSNGVVDQFYPNSIENYKDLKKFCSNVQINALESELIKNIKLLEKVSYIFITLFVKRPVRVIGTDSDYEIMNFAINVQTLKKGKIQYGAKVYTLGTLESPSQKLLTKFSGLNKKNTNKDMTITQIGCGSLGSKIIMHLGRTGITNNINLIDNGMFSAHNHARHALSNTKYIPDTYKSELLARALLEMGLSNIQPFTEDIKEGKEFIKEQQILIESTADISIRNFLVDNEIKSEVIYTVLHNHGTVGLVFIESKNREVRIDDIVAEFYLLCFQSPELSQMISNNKAQYEAIGQGCGSLTTIVSDATISLQASAMSNIIQKRLEYGSNEYGELYFGVLSDDINLSWQKQSILPPAVLYDNTYRMEVRVSTEVIKKIEAESKKYLPNETGGVLVGHISLVNRVYTIVDLIDAPEDSIRKPAYFELGTKGLTAKIAEYENKTNGLLTYIGTWHSHPRGGGPSLTDLGMKKKLMKDREDCPSVCLIYSKGEFITF